MSDERLLELERACRENEGVEQKARLILERQRLGLLGQEWLDLLLYCSEPAAAGFRVGDPRARRVCVPPPALEAYFARVQALKEQKELAVADGNFDQAVHVRDQEELLRQEHPSVWIDERAFRDAAYAFPPVGKAYDPVEWVRGLRSWGIEANARSALAMLAVLDTPPPAAREVGAWVLGRIELERAEQAIRLEPEGPVQQLAWHAVQGKQLELRPLVVLGPLTWLGYPKSSYSDSLIHAVRRELVQWVLGYRDPVLERVEAALEA